MPFCASCGSPMEGKVCPKCGAAAGSSSEQTGGAPVPAPASQSASAPMQDNVASALCYALWMITGVVFLVMEPYNKNRTVRFHAFQSIFMSVAVFLIYEALIIIGFVSYGLYQLIHLAALALWLCMMVTAYQGKLVVLPLVGQFARKQAQS